MAVKVLGSIHDYKIMYAGGMLICVKCVFRSQSAPSWVMYVGSDYSRTNGHSPFTTSAFLNHIHGWPAYMTRDNYK